MKSRVPYVCFLFFFPVSDAVILNFGLCGEYAYFRAVGKTAHFHTITYFHTIFPLNIYLFKINYRNARKTCDICSKLILKTPERCQRHALFVVFL